jgi:GTP-binding protein
MSKADKVNRATRDANLAQTRAALARHPAAYPQIVMTSSEKGEGLETLRAIIAGLE